MSANLSIPRNRRRPWLGAALLSLPLALAACEDGRRAVVVTPAVSDELRPLIDRYEIAVTLDGRDPQEALQAVPPAQVPFTLVLPADAGGHLAVAVAARAADGEQIAHGAAELTLEGLSQELALPLAATPALRTVSPARGPRGGGIQLVLGGARFAAGSHVTVAGVGAEATLVSPSQLEVTLPPSPGPLGVVPVRVTAPDEQASERADLFSYYAIGASPGASLDVPYPRQVLLSDLNGDGRPDLVVASAVMPSLLVLLGKGDGTFEAPLGDGAAESDIRDMAVADFLDKDGKPDLVLANGANRVVSVLYGLGDGTFATPRRLETGIAEGVAVGDLDGDGSLDIAVANVVSGGVLPYLYIGEGRFQPQAALDPTVGYQAVAIADLDKDGKQDLAIARNDFRGNGGVVVMLGTGGAKFGPGRRFATAGDGPQSITLADLDGDGKLDVVAALLGDTSVSVLRGAGDGTFAAPASHAIGKSTFRVAVTDFNGDGRPDIAAPLFDPGSLAVLVGNGDGTFHLGLTAQTPPRPSSVGVGDLNGDGRPDLVVNDETDGKVTVLLNGAP